MMVSASTPVLVLERVEPDPSGPYRTAGTVSYGGHRFRVVINVDPRFMGLIETVEMPRLLKIHAPSDRAVVMAMNRIRSGAEVTLPLDLTDQILDTDPPHLFVPLPPAEEARVDAAARTIDVRLDRVVWHEPGVDPPLVLADLTVDGVPMSIRVWLYAAPGAQTKMLWMGKHDPDPTPEQSRAIKLALLANRPAPVPPSAGGDR